MNTTCETSDLLVFSHLRWDFVFQRPQHLLTRHAKHRRVYYFEEPIFGMTDTPRLHIRDTQDGVQVVVPYLPKGISPEHIESGLKDLVDELIFEEELSTYTVCYYSPRALSFSDHLEPVATIFDCIEDSSHLVQENELMKKANIVFTGGHSLYEAKKHKHHNIHPFPSTIDYHHFAQARLNLSEPEDQARIPHPRLGFYGVIDERFDLDLLKQMATLRPEFHFVIIGPVVNIDPSSLPLADNIHYLGKKDYQALPVYLTGWDCAIMPYRVNDSTRYMSPTKTPEFLAAGKPCVSTAIQDVVFPYGENNLVHIASDAEEFLSCANKGMKETKGENDFWLRRVDNFLAKNSWDITFNRMAQLEKDIYSQRNIRPVSRFIHTEIYTSGVV